LISKTQVQRVAYLKKLRKLDNNDGTAIFTLILAIIAQERAHEILHIRDEHRPGLAPGAGNRVTCAHLHAFVTKVQAQCPAEPAFPYEILEYCEDVPDFDFEEDLPEYDPVLTQSWTRLREKLLLNVADQDEAFNYLVRLYSQPKRYYHNLQHLTDCLFDFASYIKSLSKSPDRPASHPYLIDVLAAIWLHDAIYDARRNDNEENSANLVDSIFPNSGEMADRIKSLILATKHRHTPNTIAEKILVDVDLAILGADRERFDEYETQIREEYSFVPSDVFRAKRREILQGFLDRPRIYSTDHFHEKLEAKARENLQRAIDRLI